MEDFREKYRQELLQQEIKSNRYTVKGFFWFLAGVAFVWLLNTIGFFEVDEKLVSIAFTSTLVLYLLPLLLYYKGDLSKPWIKYLFLSLMCVICGIIVSLLSFHAVLLYVIPLLFSIQYRRRDVIWFVYAVNTVTMLISSLLGFYYGICDLNILLQSTHTRSWYLNVISGQALNIPFNSNPVFVIIVFEVFPRSIVLFLFAIIIQYAVISSNEDAFKIARLTYLKETDLKTRVFNKNKYEEMVRQYYPRIENIAVIFWDINNLKAINDKYGHAMGDKAIETLSVVLNGYSGNRCRVYRIGGDEFVVVLDNPLEKEKRFFGLHGLQMSKCTKIRNSVKRTGYREESRIICRRKPCIAGLFTL